MSDETPKNLMTHAGTVHAPGRYYRQLRVQAPACVGSMSTAARYHYLIPIEAAVTCKKCLALLAKKAEATS